MVKHSKIIIFHKLQELHVYCADQFLSLVKSKPTAILGFATGVSPVPMYELIGHDYKVNNTDWSHITTFNLDEFIGIKPNHPEAFVAQMNHNLFRHINVLPENIHIPNSQPKDSDAAAKNYEKTIVKFGPIDLQYVSLGVNGHIAYNEPGTRLDTITHVAHLSPATIKDLVHKKKFADIASSPTQATTMGISTILKQTKKVIMVSYGAHKAVMTQKMLEDSPSSEVPATFLQKHPNCTYVLDVNAASKLSRNTLRNAEWR